MTKEHLDPFIELSQILEQLTYPKARGDILDAVREAGSRDAVVDLVSPIPEEQYQSSQDVLAAVKIAEA